ncbi:MAG: M23 family metallopeptidase [Sporomusaceae bacterium]|nr:M23 family metallopeptidase [Sporomusaceae bacterium]
MTLKPEKSEKLKDIRIPIIAVRGAAVFLCLLIVFVAGAFLHYRQTTQNAASAETTAMAIMQQTNDAQAKQIEELSITTASLNADLQRLNALDIEIRQIVNNENTTATSRAGLVRPSASYNGQGGPQGPPPNSSGISDISKLANNLQSEFKIREQSLVKLKQEVLVRQARLAATPSIWPTSGDVTSRFGSRSSPFSGGSDWHAGIDIANSSGTPVVATADGEVVWGEWSEGYGNLVEINHGNGIATLYGHNSQMIVHAGQVVKKGQVIAYMGSTGYSTGPHVHYEVKVNGTDVNPESFLGLK